MPHDVHHASNMPCTPSTAEREAADELRRRTGEVARRRFPTSDRALLAGYRATNGPLDHTVHYLSLDEQRDPRILDPEHPEGLIFEKATHGGRLLAVMYIMPRVGEPGPPVGGCLTAWHHHRLEDGRDTPDMLHVWVVDNAAGPFAEGYQQGS